MKDGGVNFLREDRVALGGGSDLVGFAVDGSAPDSATGKDCGEALGPMLSAGGCEANSSGRCHLKHSSS